MEIKKITTRTYVVSNAVNHPFMKFGRFRQVRETYGLKVQKTCFCCGHKFTDDEDTFLVAFTNTHNRLFCKDCNNKALIDINKQK